MTITDTTRILREEHVWILQVAEVLEQIARAAEAGQPLDEDSSRKCVRFIRLFADACHHGKEEDLLFEELEGHGFGRTVGPVAVMLHEHRVGRQLARDMDAALDGLTGEEEGATGRFVRAAQDYVDLIRGHIYKEDNVLFNMADRLVGAESCRRLCADYERVCARRFDGCTKAELETLALELIGRYRGTPGA